MNPALLIGARPLLFLDTETSGIRPDHHEILELAAIRLSADLQSIHGRVERQTIMQYPERAEAKALEVNRYSSAAWKNAVPIRTALVELMGLLDEDVILVGHRISFDEGFLQVAFAREGLVPPSPKYTLDTFGLAYPLALRGHFPQGMALGKICAKYGISNVGSHTAMADAKRCVLLYAAILGMQPPPEAARWV